jgi:arginine utilization regulatory protein
LRQDLFFRIAGLSLYIPPLRERVEDIIALVDYYILKYNRLMNRSVVSLSKELETILLRYDWPGNVREMEHVIENLMVRSELSDLVLELKHLPPHLLSKFMPASSSTEPYSSKELLNDVMDRTERNIIVHALKRHHGNLTAASKELGIIRQSLMYRMKRLDIERPRLDDEVE